MIEILLQCGLQDVEDENILPARLEQVAISKLIDVYHSKSPKKSISDELKIIMKKAMQMIVGQKIIVFIVVDEIETEDFHDVVSYSPWLADFAKEFAHDFKRLHFDMTRNRHISHLSNIIAERWSSQDPPLETLIISNILSRAADNVKRSTESKMSVQKFELVAVPGFYTKLADWMGIIEVAEGPEAVLIARCYEQSSFENRYEIYGHTSSAVEVYISHAETVRDIEPFLKSCVTSFGLSPNLLLRFIKRISLALPALTEYRVRLSEWKILENKANFGELQKLYTKDGILIRIIVRKSEAPLLADILSILALIPKESRRCEDHYLMDYETFLRATE